MGNFLVEGNGKLAPRLRKEPVRWRRQNEIQGIRQIHGEKPHDLGRQVPDEADSNIVARDQDQEQPVHDESGQHSGRGDHEIPPEATEHVAGGRVRSHQGHGGEDPEEHGRGLIDGKGREQGQARARRQQPLRTAAVRLERPLAQQECEPGDERCKGETGGIGPGRVDLEWKGGTSDHGNAGRLESTPAGARQRLEQAPRQQGDADHPHEPNVAQVLDIRRHLLKEHLDQDVERAALFQPP